MVSSAVPAGTRAPSAVAGVAGQVRASVELHEADGVTKLTHRLAFRDKAGRDHMTKYDGLKANYDNVEDLLGSLLDPKGTVSG